MTEEDPGKSAMELMDLGAGGEGGSRPVSKFGKYPVKMVIGLMSELLSDQDWEMMEDEGLAANFKEIGNLWGQVVFDPGFVLLHLFFVILSLLTLLQSLFVSLVVAWPGSTPMPWLI